LVKIRLILRPVKILVILKDKKLVFYLLVSAPIYIVVLSVLSHI
jgi:hypothetical protein